MDQQHALDPAMGHSDARAGKAGLPEIRGTPAPAALSEGKWLAASTEGFSEQQRGRPLVTVQRQRFVADAPGAVAGAPG